MRKNSQDHAAWMWNGPELTTMARIITMLLFFLLCSDFIFVVLAKRASYYIVLMFSTGDVTLVLHSHSVTLPRRLRSRDSHVQDGRLSV